MKPIWKVDGSYARKYIKRMEKIKIDWVKGELLAALILAKKTLKIWHGNTAWDLYQHSPEMKIINTAIENATKENQANQRIEKVK